MAVDCMLAGRLSGKHGKDLIWRKAVVVIFSEANSTKLHPHHVDVPVVVRCCHKMNFPPQSRKTVSGNGVSPEQRLSLRGKRAGVFWERENLALKMGIFHPAKLGWSCRWWFSPRGLGPEICFVRIYCEAKGDSTKISGVFLIFGENKFEKMPKNPRHTQVIRWWVIFVGQNSTEILQTFEVLEHAVSGYRRMPAFVKLTLGFRALLWSWQGLCLKVTLGLWSCDHWLLFWSQSILETKKIEQRWNEDLKKDTHNTIIGQNRLPLTLYGIMNHQDLAIGHWSAFLEYQGQEIQRWEMSCC